MKTLLLFMLCLVLLVGCGGGPDVSTSPVIVDEDFVNLYASGGHYIYRFVDKQMGVVCWVYNGFEKGGISCVPLDQTGG